MPEIINTVSDWNKTRARLKAEGKSLGFVPTMGALHPGHASLFRAAAAECDFVLASVFVNPTQFDDAWDFEHYPRMLEKDCAIMDAAGVDAVLAPSVQEMYPNGTDYFVSEKIFSTQLCGAHRPGHFDGVLTVVLKLLQIAGADRAYFGEKDHQQLRLIQGMCKAFFLPVTIVPCPTLREPDGLAMSSRNARLSPPERALAPEFHRLLSSAPSAAECARMLRVAGFDVDYVEDLEGRRYGAVRLGKTRLIDNVAL